MDYKEMLRALDKQIESLHIGLIKRDARIMELEDENKQLTAELQRMRYKR